MAKGVPDAVFLLLCADPFFYFLGELLQLSKYSVSPFTMLSVGSGETPTMETIDSYMNRLHGIIMANPQENENLIATVRDVVNRLER